MSAIYGYINLDGRPVDPEILQKMKDAMAFCGHDGSFSWHEGNCGMGQLLLFNTPEAVNEKYPLIDASGNIVFVAACRIDNRVELFNLLDTPNELKHSITDGELMFQCYLKYGENACDKMLGDWSFAAWHKKEQKFFLARDHHGITAMYYYKGPNIFVFSSSLKGLLCLKQIPIKINEYYVAQILVGWNESGSQCSYLDIFRIPPSHTLKIDRYLFATNRYWYLENTPELHYKNPDDYISAFMEIYRAAVKCRLRSYRPVGATLSGGLDSSSVCVLAAEELKKEGKRLTAFTAVPLYEFKDLIKPGRIGNEGPLAKEIAEYVGNIDNVFCRAESISPFDGIDKMMQIHDQPVFAVSNAYWILDIFENAKRHGIGTLLIAQGGNNSVSFPCRNHLDEIKNKNYFKNKLKSFLRFKLFNLLQSHYWKEYKHLNKEYLKSLNISIKDILINSRTRFDHSNSLKKINLFQLKAANIPMTFNWYENGISYYTEVRDPTIDKRILDICFSIPEQILLEQDDRFLIKKGFSLQLPSKIIESKCQNAQSADLTRRTMNLSSFNTDHLQLNLQASKYFNSSKETLSNNLSVSNSLLKPYMLSLFYEKRGIA